MSEALSPTRTILKSTLRAFNTNKTSWVGLVIFVIVVLAAIFAPWIAPLDPLDQNVMLRLKPPSEDNWLGTDYYGRDIYARLVYGARISLIIGLASTALSMVVGSAIGMIAGWRGGRNRCGSSSACGYRVQQGVWMITRTSCRAACASG